MGAPPWAHLQKGLADLAGRGQVLWRQFQSRYELVDGESSPCPRCKGCGLLGQEELKPRGRQPKRVQPCWFCEGVGIFPIVDLHGYVFAATPPLLGGADRQESAEGISRLPTKHAPFVTFSTKYPTARCRISTYRPPGGIRPMKYKKERSQWIRDADPDEAVAESPVQDEDWTYLSVPVPATASFVQDEELHQARLEQAAQASTSASLAGPLTPEVAPIGVLEHFPSDHVSLRTDVATERIDGESLRNRGDRLGIVVGRSAPKGEDFVVSAGSTEVALSRPVEEDFGFSIQPGDEEEEKWESHYLQPVGVISGIFGRSRRGRRRKV